LLRSLDAALADQLCSIPYNSSSPISLGYEKSSFDGKLNGFRLPGPPLERGRMVACTQVGTKFPCRVPEDKVMLRCFLGGESEETDEDLAAHVGEELRRIIGLTAQLFVHQGESLAALHGAVHGGS